MPLCRLLYELADRDDCGVTDLLERCVVVIVPTQNPDGREKHFRRNAYAFDMNQDHLTRTQPENDGKIELMRQYPPAVLTDHHEFGYYRSFFPPNDDPVYHETPEQTVRQINDCSALGMRESSAAATGSSSTEGTATTCSRRASPTRSR